MNVVDINPLTLLSLPQPPAIAFALQVRYERVRVKSFDCRSQLPSCPAIYFVLDGGVPMSRVKKLTFRTKFKRRTRGGKMIFQNLQFTK